MGRSVPEEFRYIFLPPLRQHQRIIGQPHRLQVREGRRIVDERRVQRRHRIRVGGGVSRGTRRRGRERAGDGIVELSRRHFAGRPLRAGITLRSWNALRPLGSTGIALRTLRALGSRIALRTGDPLRPRRTHLALRPSGTLRATGIALSSLRPLRTGIALRSWDSLGSFRAGLPRRPLHRRLDFIVQSIELRAHLHGVGERVGGGEVWIERHGGDRRGEMETGRRGDWEMPGGAVKWVARAGCAPA